MPTDILITELFVTITKFTKIYVLNDIEIVKLFLKQNIMLLSHWLLNPGQARHELGSWKKIWAAVGTADMLYSLMADTAERDSSGGTYIGIHELAICQAITSLCVYTVL